MRSVEDKGCLNLGQIHEISGTSNGLNLDFHKGNGGVNRASHHRMALGKPTPSKWDDAQKWLVNLSRGGERNQSKTEPRNSNADDRRLIAPVVPKKEDSSSDDEEGNECPGPGSMIPYEVETKKVQCEESVWKIDKVENSTSVVRSIHVRDMGTDMTPIASKEPSRTATPVRANSPATARIPIPITPGPTAPVRSQVVQPLETSAQVSVAESRGSSSNTTRFREEPDNVRSNVGENSTNIDKTNPLETRAMAWDEAERAKYMARYKGEEVRIQAWENHEKRKAEMEMKRIEVKAERLKSRAQEKYNNKLASLRRIAEEKLANAEAKLNEQAVKTSERADYIRRTGHLPSSFSLCKFKLPSCCQ